MRTKNIFVMFSVIFIFGNLSGSHFHLICVCVCVCVCVCICGEEEIQKTEWAGLMAEEEVRKEK
jgi:hypothetical protein